MESTRNGNLPEELVREILLRLPVKALLQCKCVCIVYVYNLSSDSWKRIEAVDLLNSMFCAFGYTCNTFLNGVYHWLMGWVNRGGFTILAFDMRSENFQEIRVPDGLKFRQTRLRITAYGDSLALLSYDVIAQLLDLWVMGKEGFWSKSLRVGPFQDVMWPLCVWKKNVMLEESKTSAVFLCDISTKKVRKVEQESNPCHLRSVFSYMESLVSIKGDRDRADSVKDFFEIPPDVLMNL